MSTAWVEDVVPSSEVLAGIAVLQKSAAHDAELFSRVLDMAAQIIRGNASLSEAELVERVTREAAVNESLASSAVWRLSDSGAVTQDGDALELSFAG